MISISPNSTGMSPPWCGLCMCVCMRVRVERGIENTNVATIREISPCVTVICATCAQSEKRTSWTEYLTQRDLQNLQARHPLFAHHHRHAYFNPFNLSTNRSTSHAPDAESPSRIFRPSTSPFCSSPLLSSFAFAILRRFLRGCSSASFLTSSS